jgi:hypothetical protein
MAQGGIGTSLTLVAVGAILRWAITTHVSGVSLPTVGLILIIVGIVGFVVSLFELALWAPRRRARVTTAPEYEPTRRYG